MPEEPEEQDDPDDLDEPHARDEAEALDEPGDRGEEDDERPLFGRFDAATLMAVEGANGGEWASLGQVLITFEHLFGELPEADGFAESCGLLCAAGLVEYAGEGLDMASAGRKLLRRAGRHGSADRPTRVVELLARFDEGDLGEEGAVETPTADEVAAALDALTDEVALDFGGVLASNEARRLGPPTMFGYGPGRPLDIDPVFGRDGHTSDAGTDDEDASWPEDLDEEADAEENWSPDVE